MPVTAQITGEVQGQSSSSVSETGNAGRAEARALRRPAPGGGLAVALARSTGHSRLELFISLLVWVGFKFQAC